MRWMSIRNFLNHTNGYSDKRCAKTMLKIFFAVVALFFVSGCAEIPIRDGELVMGKNTTATVEDLGAVRINNRF